MRLGLIAGGGELPKYVISAASNDALDVSVIALDGFADPADFNGAQVLGIAQYGAMLKALKRAQVSHICFAGTVKRPDFKRLKPDFKGLVNMPGAIKAAKQGDDALLRYILTLFEKEGFKIIAPQDICKSLLLSEGILGGVKLDSSHKVDVKLACETAVKIGALDIGQGAVVCQGLVLAVEAQEGTDNMLMRVASLPKAITGTPSARKGVLAKMLKPTQDTRVDLPTIGPETIRLAGEAGIAGIVAEAGKCFVIEREVVITQADAAGIFIAGLPPARP